MELTELYQQYSDLLVSYIVIHGAKVLLAIITLIIGLWLINLLLNGIANFMRKRSIDPTLQPFTRSLIGIILRILLIISVASMIGIETTSFIAMLGAAGLAIGLALQGSLANFAGGILILVFKPFRVGDVIEGQGHIGKVKEIQIFYTVLNTGDNKTVIIPNGKLSNESITNFTFEPFRRVDFIFGISYSDNIELARAIIFKVIEADERIEKDPPPMVVVSQLADSSVNLTVRVWAKSEFFWPIFFETQEKVKNAFDAGGITIPFPQRDVHMHKN